MRWLLILLLLPFVYADVSVLTADLGDNHYTYEYVGNEAIKLPAVIDNVEVIVNGREGSCDVMEHVGYTLLDCGGGTNSVIASFTTEYPLIELGEQTLWRYSGADEVRVILPSTAIIDDTRLIIPVARMYEYNGRLVIHWMQPADEYQLSFKQSGFSMYWLLLLLLPVAYYYWPRSSNHLLENEKKVVTALRIHGSLWTKELLYKTKLSKVKMSRLLKSMEKRGIIEREAYGNSHKIKLK